MAYLELLKEKLKDSEGSDELLKLLNNAVKELESPSKDLQKKVAAFTKAFGEDESTYLEKAKQLAEYPMLLEKVEKLNGKLEEATKEKQQAVKQTNLLKQCTQLGIDQEALTILLDDSLEITPAGVMVEGKEIPLDKFIETDNKLSKFKGSLFIQEAQEEAKESPTVAPTVPSSGRGSTAPNNKDAKLDDVFNQYLNTYWKDKSSKIKERFS
jgi:hypothetical protein